MYGKIKMLKIKSNCIKDGSPIEAIIDRDTFERIQQGRGNKSAVKHERHPLTGRLECGCCHKSLKIARTKNPYFFCKNRYVTLYEGCAARINVQFMEQYLLFRLQEEAEGQTDIQRAIAEARHRAGQELSKEQKIRGQLFKELEDLQAAEAGIYEAYVFGAKSREEYAKEKQDLQEQIKHCSDRQEESARRIKTLKALIDKGDSSIYESIQNHSFTELTGEIVDRFVKRIVVYDEKNIEVEWNFSKNLPGALFQYKLAAL